MTIKTLSARVGAMVVFATAVFTATGSIGEERQSPWWWNMWEPGTVAPWDLRSMTPEQRRRMMRHWTFMNKQVPATYLDTTNRVGYTLKAIEAGGALYGTHCARCHGTTGMGDGSEAGDLTPSPALLAYLVQEPIAIDQYLLWSISEGGREFGTDMPAFKDTLSQDDIWNIVAYLRAGFPAIESPGR